jgi:hypothetical protein
MPALVAGIPFEGQWLFKREAGTGPAMTVKDA